MKVAFVVTALISSLTFTESCIAAVAKPPAAVCFTFTDEGFVFNFLLTTKAESGNIAMQSRTFKAYSVTGALSIDGSDAVPISGAATAYTNGDGDDIVKFNVAGTVVSSFFGVYGLNGRVNWNATQEVGQANAIAATKNGNVEFSGPLTLIPCKSFDFAIP